MTDPKLTQAKADLRGAVMHWSHTGDPDFNSHCPACALRTALDALAKAQALAENEHANANDMRQSLIAAEAKLKYVIPYIETEDGIFRFPNGDLLEGCSTKLKQAEARGEKLREALRALVIVNGKEIGYRTMHGIPMQMATAIERKVRAALAAAKEES